MAALQKSLDRARSFSQPAIAAQGSSTTLAATQTLAQSLYGDSTLAYRREIVRQACALLQDVERSLRDDALQNASVQTVDIATMAVLFPLLDLILLEGVYPSLASGVGFPQERQRRSTLCNRACAEFPDLHVLPDSLTVLNFLVFNVKSALSRRLQDTILLDVIAANAQLAFSPEATNTNRDVAAKNLAQHLKDVPTSRLHQTLTVLIKASAPSWLREGLSLHLSLLALRPRGVWQTIEFLASYYDIQMPSGLEAPTSAFKRRPIHPEALIQAIKVLTSVPSTMTTEEYYAQTAPQLLDLLDGESGAELGHAAGKIIATGILTKRDVGAPGKVGWQAFIARQIESISPSDDDAMSGGGSHVGRPSIIVSDNRLEQALKRLVTILQATINVALTGRVLRPILTSLWRIVAYNNTILSSNSTTLASELCQMFLQRCGTIDHLRLLHRHLFSCGNKSWTLGAGEAAGIAIRSRNQNDIDLDDTTALAEKSARVDRFVNLLHSSQLNEDVVGDFFIEILTDLLHQGSSTSGDCSTLLAGDRGGSSDLLSIYLVQSLFSRFGQSLLSNPQQILELLNQVLEEATTAREGPSQEKPSVAMLNTLALHNSRQNEADQAAAQDVIETGISLLNAVLSQPDLVGDESIRAVLSSIRAHLKVLVMSAVKFDNGLRSSISSTIDVVERVMQSEFASLAVQPEENQVSRILRSFTTDEPAMQAEALMQLSPIICDRSKHLDVPALTTILLQEVRMNQDEYIHPYLNKVLAQVATRRSTGYIIRATTDAFRDADQQTGLDGRLRLGEALTSIVEAVARSPDRADEAGTLMDHVVTACLALAGRRSSRTLEQKQRATAARQAKMQQRRAERAWGGEVPRLDTLEADLEDGGPAQAHQEQHEEYTSIEKMIRGWEGVDKQEDVRVRTSALSVVNTVLETAGAVLSPESITNAVAMASAILHIETADEAYFLRRAAVLVPMAHIRAVDSALEDNVTVPTLDTDQWLEIQERLTAASVNDTDDLVRGNAVTVLESLEALRMKQLLLAQEMAQHRSLAESGRLQGLDLRLDNSSTDKIQVLE